MAFSQSGFAVLIWVNPDSPLLKDVSAETRERLAKQLLADAACLCGVRWNIDFNIMQLHGESYAYGCCTRFTVGDRTLRNALGDLTLHVDFLRASASATAEELVHYRQCREKWKVPEQVSDSTTGWDEPGQGATSTGAKRKRY